MTKYNRDYVKPDAEMRPLFAPMPLRIEIHHHEEWDEDIIDPETGEPTGEKEHKEYDWVEYRTVIHPEEPDILLAGYLPLSPDRPVDQPEGKHYERTGKIEPDGGGYRWAYALVDDPPPPPRVFVTADLVEQLMQSGVWEQARAWIVEQGMLDLVLATAEFTEDNENFQSGKAALQSALGWTDEEVEELLAKCVKEGA